jgi:serine/threonine protein kinase, bacterial
VVSTFAGRGRGFADGNASTALFFEPYGIVADPQGNFYISDRGNGRIRKITPPGVVSTLAGSGNPAPFAFADGAGSAAQFYGLQGIAIDKQGNLYVADQYNNRIRKITPAGLVSTLAGASSKGFADSDGTSPALFNQPAAVAADSQGNVYVADFSNHSIRRITPAGVVSTIAGNGKPGYVDGAGQTAQFRNPSGIAVDEKGNIYVADSSNGRIRKIVLE